MSRPETHADESERRRFLRTLLRGSVYVPPTLAVMSLRNVAAQQATGPMGMKGKMFMKMKGMPGP